MLDADTIVIGSGAGGLASAVALAQAGEKVLVLEQHYAPGGWCHSFVEEGLTFSPGVHYVGLLGPGESSRRMYEGLGLADDLAFYELNRDGYDHFRVRGDTFDLPTGKDAMVERFTRRFPHEAKGIEDYFFLVERISGELELINETKSLRDFLTIPYRTRHMGRYGAYSLERILKDRIGDPTLRSFLSLQCGDHGLPPSRAPFALHAAVAGHFLNGAYYPAGGGKSIPRAFIRALRRAGGDIRLSTRVDKILIEKRGRRRQALGVRLSDGTELRSRRVVSNATPTTTYLDMVGAEHLSRGLKRKLARTRYSLASVSLFLGTELDLVGMGFDSGNYWYVQRTDFEEQFRLLNDPAVLERDEVPGVFLGISTLKDPGSFDGRRHAIEAVTFLGARAFDPYRGSEFGNRSEAYEELKRRLTDAMLKCVERIIPGIRDNLFYCDMGTPLTNEHYIHTTDGSAYGTEKSLGQIGPFSFKPMAEIGGLGLCGSSILSHGVTGAAFSGLNMAAEFLKCRPSELLNARGQDLRIYSAEDASTWPAPPRPPRRGEVSGSSLPA